MTLFLYQSTLLSLDPCVFPSSRTSGGSIQTVLFGPTVFKLSLFSREHVSDELIFLFFFELMCFSIFLSSFTCTAFTLQRRCCITTCTSEQRSTWATRGCTRTLCGCGTPLPELDGEEGGGGGSQSTWKGKLPLVLLLIRIRSQEGRLRMVAPIIDQTAVIMEDTVSSGLQ